MSFINLFLIISHTDTFLRADRFFWLHLLFLVFVLCLSFYAQFFCNHFPFRNDSKDQKVCEKKEARGGGCLRTAKALSHKVIHHIKNIQTRNVLVCINVFTLLFAVSMERDCRFQHIQCYYIDSTPIKFSLRVVRVLCALICVTRWLMLLSSACVCVYTCSFISLGICAKLGHVSFVNAQFYFYYFFIFPSLNRKVLSLSPAKSIDMCSTHVWQAGREPIAQERWNFGARTMNSTRTYITEFFFKKKVFRVMLCVDFVFHCDLFVFLYQITTMTTAQHTQNTRMHNKTSFEYSPPYAYSQNNRKLFVNMMNAAEAKKTRNSQITQSHVPPRNSKRPKRSEEFSPLLLMNRNSKSQPKNKLWGATQTTEKKVGKNASNGD